MKLNPFSSTLKCTEPFSSQGGKIEGLAKIQSLSKVELQEFLCREVSTKEYDLIVAGGVSGAAFILPEFSWSDAEKVKNIGYHEMLKELISTQNFTDNLEPESNLILQDLYSGTSPVFG